MKPGHGKTEGGPLLPRPKRPAPDDIAAAVGRTVSDVIGPGLDLLFCGINPGLWSAAVGHHFARPGNRFWKVLHQSGFTPEQLEPSDERRLLEFGIGITNLVSRASSAAGDLTTGELRAGGARLVQTLDSFKPRYVAVLGIGAFRRAFGQPRAVIGPQTEPLGPCTAWLLPNPSGLQARYQLPALVAHFSTLREAVRGS